MSPLLETEDGVILTLRLTSKSGRDKIDGVHVGNDGRPYLKIRVSAPPVDGSANKALLKFLAKSLNLPKSAIRIQSGATSKLKRLTISGEASDIRKLLAL